MRIGDRLREWASVALFASMLLLAVGFGIFFVRGLILQAASPEPSNEYWVARWWFPFAAVGAIGALYIPVMYVVWPLFEKLVDHSCNRDRN